MQHLCIGVTTKSPDSGLPICWHELKNSDQYWCIENRTSDCIARHDGQYCVLRWDLQPSPDNTFGVAVSEKGELHLYHNGRDVGVAWEGLPTDALFWGLVDLQGGRKVETNYMIAKGEAVTCGEVVCGVIFCVLLN